MASRRGWFITFEGIDGSGKTTQMRLFAAALRREGARVIETSEPGGTLIGGAIRAVLLNPAHHMMSATAEMLLYFAARAQNVDELLEPALAKGEIVISDRWTDSTRAYQGCGRGLGGEIVERLDAIACRGRKPDLTFWIDAPIEASLRRAKARNAGSASTETRMDEQSLAFYQRAWEGYRSLAAGEPARIVRIAGDAPVEVVAARVQQSWHDFLGRHD